MGSNWIKWVKGLTKRTEVVRMASGQMSALVADRRRIAVACMEFWEWADDETQDGAIAGCTPAFVDDLVSLPGFYAAMVGVDWITETPQGIVIKHFERHNGESAKRRAMESDRKRTGRMSAQDADKCPQTKRTKSGPDKTRTIDDDEEVSPFNGEQLQARIAALRRRPDWLQADKPWVSEPMAKTLAKKRELTAAILLAAERVAKEGRNTLRNPAGCFLSEIRKALNEAKGKA